MRAKPLCNSPSCPVRKETRTGAKPGELHGPLHERERLSLQVSTLIGEGWGGGGISDKGSGHCSCYGVHDALQRSNTPSTDLEYFHVQV